MRPVSLHPRRDLARTVPVWAWSTSLPAPEAGLTSNVRREAPLAHKRESVRSGIAYMLAGALVGVVAIGAVGWLVIRAPLQDWTTFTSPLFTLVATMVGYYYGRRDS